MSSNSTDKEIRKFGIIAFIVFGTLLVVVLILKKTAIAILFFILAALGLGFILAPALLAPAYKGWLKITHVIGIIVNTILLTLVYYLIVTSTAIVKRMFGGVPLPTRPDKGVKTYWVERSESLQPKERFEKRY